ncbi:MAG: hypothetical protein FD188_3549, partial [Ignavibacteria bacterium]
KEFAKNLPIKGHEELSACQIHSSYDNVTQKISLSTKCIVDFRMITLNERLNAHIGAVCTPWDNKIFITDPNCFGVRRAFLHNCMKLCIYFDAVKYKIIGRTQAPLLATLRIQGIPNDQSFVSFNPPYTCH